MGTTRTHPLSMTHRARSVLTTTGWVAVVALAGVTFHPTPEALAAGVTTVSYSVTDQVSASRVTSSAPPRSEAA